MSVRFIHNIKDITGGGNSFAIDRVDGRLFVGVSHCSPKDQFSKKIGRGLAYANLKELIQKYNEDGIEVITVGTTMKKCGKITGFVVNDDIMFHLFMDRFSEFSLISDVISHIITEVIEIDYFAIEGADLRKMLIEYYNEIVEETFPEDNKVYID